MIEWLKEFAPKHNIYEIIVAFNERFGTNKDYQGIRHYLRYYNIPYIKNPKNSFRYGEEHEKWINENYDKYETRKSMFLDFKEKFNLDLGYTGFLKMISKRKGSKQIHIYSEEEKEWVKNNYKNYVIDGTFKTSRFINDYKERFDYEPIVKDLKSTFKRMGLEKPRAIPTLERYPLGFEKEYAEQTYVKVDDRYITEELRNQKGFIRETFNYRKKTNVMYEKYHNVNVDDENQVVIQLDGDKNNYSKENLYLIDQKAYRTYLSSRYKNETLETKLLALKVSEITNKIRSLE